MVATTAVTIEQAAVILGLSPSTVRRRIRAGVLRVEEVSRPQGIMRLVYLPDGVDPAVTQVSGLTGVAATTPATDPGAAMIAYTQTLLVPLVTALERSEARGRDQAEQLGRLAERLDSITAELDMLRAAHSPVASMLTPWHRVRASWLLGLLAIVVLVVLPWGWGPMVGRLAELVGQLRA